MLGWTPGCLPDTAPRLSAPSQYPASTQPFSKGPETLSYLPGVNIASRCQAGVRWGGLGGGFLSLRACSASVLGDMHAHVKGGRAGQPGGWLWAPQALWTILPSDQSGAALVPVPFNRRVLNMAFQTHAEATARAGAGAFMEQLPRAQRCPRPHAGTC